MNLEAAKSNPKRRWRQFRLRTFFVLVTVLCVWFGWQVHRAKQQREAVKWVRESGGSVRYDYECDEDCSLLPDAEPPVPKWLYDTLGVDFFDDVAWVSLHSTQVSDLTPLARLKGIRGIDLGLTPVSDLSPLANLKSIQRLSVYKTQISDLGPLRRLTSLQMLYVGGTRVSELAPLAYLKALRLLHAGNTQVSDLGPLAKLPNLQNIYLDSTEIRDLTPLTKVTSLEVLSVIETQVGEEQVENLQQALQHCEIKMTP